MCFGFAFVGEGAGLNKSSGWRCALYWCFHQCRASSETGYDWIPDDCKAPKQMRASESKPLISKEDLADSPPKP